VAYLLKARIVEPEKQPSLENCSETKFVSRQRLGKHVPKVTDTHATIEVLLETVFYIRSLQRGYKEVNWGNRASSAREAVEKKKKKGQLEESWKGTVIQRRPKRGC
jgi:hypothetical protein